MEIGLSLPANTLALMKEYSVNLSDMSKEISSTG
jgi:hypothetical protein